MGKYVEYLKRKLAGQEDTPRYARILEVAMGTELIEMNEATRRLAMSNSKPEQPSKKDWDRTKYKTPLQDPAYVKAMLAEVDQQVAEDAKRPVHPINLPKG